MSQHEVKPFRMMLFFCAIIALLILNGWFIFTNFDETTRNEKSVIHTIEVMNEMNLIMSALKDAETGVRGYSLTSQESYLEPYHAGVAQTWKHFNQVITLTKDNPRQTSSLEVLRGLVIQRLDFLKEMLGHISDTKSKKDEFLSVTEGKIVMDTIREHVESMKRHEQELLDMRQKEAEKSRTFFIVSVLLSTISGLIIFSFAFYLFQRHITSSQLENQKKAHEAWLKEHVAELSREVAGDIPLKTVSENILSFISKRFSAPAARLFSFDGKNISSVASYGTPVGSNKLVAKDNLINQAMKKNDIWQITDVPEDYWNINSSLGESRPKALVFLPFNFQNRTIGVIEIASFTPFTDQQIEALTQVGEILGVTINAALSRDHLQRLLETTQQQAEELQAQQEELKTNNEELEQQTRALESQQQALNSKNRELEISRREVEGKAKELERSSQYKSEFLAKMSHELRTPLNGLLILSTLLAENKDKNLTEQQIQFSRSINTAGEDLLLLINDILDLSKIEARKLTMRPEEFSLENMIDQMTVAFKPQTDMRGLKLNVSLSPETKGLKLFTDRQRVEQILRNFLSNAIKFTEHGSITIEAKSTAETRSVKITVKDTGIGIREDKKAQIFEAFEQGDGSISRKYGGTGLGLTISRELAALLGGNITVESEESKGSSFSLQIPTQLQYNEQTSVPLMSQSHVSTVTPTIDPQQMISSSDAKKRATEILKDIPLNGKTILIVEDDEKFRSSVVETAKNYGFIPIEAVDGEVAFAILQQHTPSAVLLDIKLPGISGLGLLEMVKQMPHLRHIPIHMISALDYQHNALRMGALGYLTKPVTLEKVRSALGRIEDMLSKKVRRVLVIEDDERQSHAISELISGNDVEVLAAKTGKNAVKQLKESNFDCIILDLTLPDVSGFDLLSELNSLDISLPPIVIYTGKDLTPDEEDYLRRYSESIIIKGVRSPERLLDEVNLFLHRVESLLPPEKKEMLSHLRSQGHSFEGKTVLLVDDDLRNVFALTNALESKGLNVRIAKNGQEAVDMLHEHTDIDLTLMDIMMPVMDGFEAMKIIRKSRDKRLQKMPIIALTAKAMREDHEKCIEAGASDYLPKPVNLDNLMTAMKVWLSQERIYT